VPFSEKGNYKAKQRQFAPNGWPLCAAGLTMPLKFTYTDRTTAILEHERGKYVCPLTAAAPARQTCPIRHPRWKKGGCTAMMPTSMGARIRYTLDRDSDLYKQIYRQRTAVERINSQAVALGIERPHLRNGPAIANQNTLIYLLINLRFLKRLQQGLQEDE
jgi:Transposase DDE domain